MDTHGIDEIDKLESLTFFVVMRTYQEQKCCPCRYQADNVASDGHCVREYE